MDQRQKKSYWRLRYKKLHSSENFHDNNFKTYRLSHTFTFYVTEEDKKSDIDDSLGLSGV